MASVSALAQNDGRDVALSLRQNTVRIAAQFGELPENGFGFVVAEKDGTVYVVTADHVVNSKEPDAPPAKIRVELFDPKILILTNQGVQLATIFADTALSFSLRVAVLFQ